ncbi:lytic transglycosylase domain-containing protein [Neptuniibacter sp. QD37_11]|uniref:lytic transglycosylase domain-containing protein n=1 Tax=Neptuniibacter sp. QD37_11 TaxID=3398209 RepID=UPI0039F4CE33
MLDIPDNLPTPVMPNENAVDVCIIHASQRLKVDPVALKAIRLQEAGKIGSVMKNTNGSYDLGVMQINTIHMPDLKKRYRGITWQDVAYKPCTNIAIAARMLQQRISEAGQFWKGVGNYHSKTPKYHNKYLGLVKNRYNKLKKQRWAAKANQLYGRVMKNKYKNKRL